MLSDAIKPLQEAYNFLEDKYYGFLDALERYAPVYEWFVNPIESRGVPSFPVAVLLFLLLVGSALLLLSPPSAIELRVTVYGKAETTTELLDGASVEVLEDSKVLFSATTRKGRAVFSNVPPKTVRLAVSKKGFKSEKKTVDAPLQQSVRFELACEDQEVCAEILKGKAVVLTPTPTPTKFESRKSELLLADKDPESTIGRLLLIVRDKQGNPLDAKGKVFDFETSALIGEVNVAGGSGLLLGLKAGRKIYVNVAATGFRPYEGKAEAFTISPATNKLKIVLESADGADVRFFITTTKDSPVENAEISVRSLESPGELQKEFSDAEGKASVKVGNGTYYAVVSKAGFVTNYSSLFKAGESVRVVLPMPSEVALASLEARVVDDKGQNASASVVVLQKTSFRALFALAEKQTQDGIAAFDSLIKGSEVEVRATDGEKYANASLALTQENNTVLLTLRPKPFLIKAFAYDPLAKTPVQKALFTSFFETQQVGSCSGNGCMLEVRSGVQTVINASAEGYASAQMSFLLTVGLEENVTLYIVSLDALKDSFVQWAGLFDSRGKLLPQTTQLKPGNSYQARLQVYSKNADTSGVVFSTGNNQVFLTGHAPAGFSQKGSYADSCSTTDVKYGEFDKFSWVDVSYQGDASSAIAFNFTIDQQIDLDPATRTKTLSLKYRSYITRKDEYIRNPFDLVLLNKAGEDHPSGCNVEHYKQEYVVKSGSTTCSKEGCVSISFVQGEQTGADGFVVKSKVTLWNETYEPLRILYAVELFSDYSTASLQLEAPAKHVVIWNATDPILGESPVAQGKKQCDFSNGRLIRVDGSLLALDLSELKKCSNFALPLKIEGVATARALEAGEAEVRGTLRKDAGQVSHASTTRVEGFGIAADANAIVEARFYQPLNTQADQEPFPALSTGACTAEQAMEGKCEAGALNITFRVTALKEGAFGIEALSSFLPPYVASSGLGRFTLDKGKSAQQGEAHFLAPITQGEGAVEVSRINEKKTTLSRRVRVGGERFTPNESIIFPPGFDTCNGLIEIKYEPGKNPPFSVGKGCTDLGMRISTIFPGDAAFLNVSLPEFGRVVTRLVKTDGSQACYEICEYDKNKNIYGCQPIGKELYTGTQYLLRYSPDVIKTCPTAYKVSGNKIAGSEVTIEFGYTEDTTALRNVTVHVLADVNEKSLYISPVLTFYLGALAAGVSPRYPQLWAVANHKQVGKRDILITEPSNLVIHFDGPGVKVFSVFKDSPTARVLAYEAPEFEKPVLDSSNVNSPVQPFSEYNEELIRQKSGVQGSVSLPPEEQAKLNTEMRITSDNSLLDSAVAEAISARILSLAKKTMYWRSSSITIFCQQTQSCASSAYTLEGCCKNSLESWKNYSIMKIYRTEYCTFCNNTFNPSCTNTTQAHLNQYLPCTYEAGAKAFQCDQRCTAKNALPAETLKQADILGVTASGLTVDMQLKKPLAYGLSVDGRTCEVFFSSLNAFVQAGVNAYSKYNPLTPMASITNGSIQRCIANGECPLLLSAQLPQCVIDANNNGLADEGETLQNPAIARGSDDRETRYQCQQGIVAVGANAFFKPALQGGKIASRSIITRADVQRCKQGHCPLMYASFPQVGENLLCFRDSNGNGFYEDSVTGEASSLEFGTATGFGDYACPSGKIPAIANICISGCENYCALPRCDSSSQCKTDGVKYIPTGEEQKAFLGWLNQSPVVEVQQDAAYLSRGFEKAPASFFSDMFQDKEGKPLFSHSFIVDSRGKAGELASLSKVVSVSGCGDGSDYEYGSSLLKNEGLYEIRNFNTLDVAGENWVAEAKAIELPLEKYSAASRANLCRKPTWNTRFCDVMYNDVSSQYGACFNSILKFVPGLKKLGVDVPLLGGLGFGAKSGLGYGVSPGGQVFALFEPTRVTEFCEGESRVREYRQTLYHWPPDGKKTDSREFLWRYSTGCHPSCGCKSSGGGYGYMGYSGGDSGDSGGGGSSAAGGSSTTISDTGAYGMSPYCQPWGPFGDTMAYGCRGISWAMNPSG